MFRVTADIPTAVLGEGQDLRSLKSRLEKFIGIAGDAVHVHPDCGLFSVDSVTQETMESTVARLRELGLQVEKPFRV